jgi:predicted MFS family arabinose efflux permease
VATLAVTLLWSAGSFTFFSYLAIVLHATAAIRGVGVAAELLLFGVAGVIGAYVAGRATDLRGPVSVAAAALSAMVLGEAGLALVAATRPAHVDAVALTSALIAIYGLGTWGVTPAQQHRLLGLAPERARMVLSLNATALYVGVAIGGAVGGLVITTSRSAVVLCLTGATFVGLGLVLLEASRRTARTGAEVEPTGDE